MLSIEQRLKALEPDNTMLSVSRQCALLAINRGRLYYQQEPIDRQDIEIMNEIRTIYGDMIIPKKNHKPAIIIEFKIARRGETLEVAAQKALDQIHQKQYAQELYAKSITAVIE